MNLFGRRSLTLDSQLGAFDDGLPFLFELSQQQLLAGPIARAKRYIRAFELAEERLAAFSIAMSIDGAKRLSKGPPVVETHRAGNEREVFLNLGFKRFTASRRLVVGAIVVIDDEGYAIWIDRKHRCEMEEGDTLLMTQRLHFDFNGE